MRTFLSKTALGAVIIATLFACTKNAKDTQLITADGALSAVTAKGQPEKTENTPPQKPVLTVTQDPGPASVGKPVKITYSATNPVTNATVGCGRIFIYQWIDAQWTKVGEGDAPSASFEFTPTTATDCAYKFRAGYTPGGTDKCGDAKYSGVDYTDGSEYCLDVQDCVEKFTIGHEDVIATPVGDGIYEFTITYTLTSPVDLYRVKFQGGATAGGAPGSTISDDGNTTYKDVKNQNTVLGWEGDLKACTPQKVWFKYKRNFNCPETGTATVVTGNWSASANGQEKAEIAPLTYTCPK